MIPSIATDNVALAVVGGLALVLIGVLGMVMRSIVRGDLVPRATVERERERDTERINAQADALAVIPGALTEVTTTQKSLADSFGDLADAAQLQVRLADALHRQVEGATDART